MSKFTKLAILIFLSILIFSCTPTPKEQVTVEDYKNATKHLSSNSVILAYKYSPQNLSSGVLRSQKLLDKIVMKKSNKKLLKTRVDKLQLLMTPILSVISTSLTLLAASIFAQLIAYSIFTI